MSSAAANPPPSQALDAPALGSRHPTRSRRPRTSPRRGRSKNSRTHCRAYYLWDGLNLLEERDFSGTLQARYTHGYSRLPGIGTVVEIERHVGAANYYQYGLGDHRGTFYKITDENQDVQLDYTLDAFGRELAGIGGVDPGVPNDLVYQTNWLTLQIGNRSYGLSKYRIYDPELGIFLSRDFLNYPNKYRAWSNNPVGEVDAEGLASEAVHQSLNAELDRLQGELQNAANMGDINKQNNIFNQIRELELQIGSINRNESISEHGIGQRSENFGDHAADFIAGWGDDLSFNLSAKAREGIWGYDLVDKSSKSYLGGQAVGTIHSFFLPGGAAKLGPKLKTALQIYNATGAAVNAIDLATQIRKLVRCGDLSLEDGVHLLLSAAGTAAHFRNLKGSGFSARGGGRGNPTGPGRSFFRSFFEDRGTFRQWEDFRRRWNIPRGSGWSLEHLLGKQRWVRGAQPIVPRFFNWLGERGIRAPQSVQKLAAKGVQGLVDSGWNTIPLPLNWNQWLFNNPKASWTLSGVVLGGAFTEAYYASKPVAQALDLATEGKGCGCE